MPATPPPAPPTPPAVHLGDGQIGGIATLGDDKTIHRATSDTGNLPPVYPPDAARRHEQGIVTLRMHIAVDGHVSDIDVLISSGYRSLDEAARTKLATWHFKPALQDGLPVEDVMDIGVNFRP